MRKNTLASLLFVIALALIPAAFSAHSLQKGQVIKQFFAFSLTESLARQPLELLHTSLPCEPPRLWAEEPPLFHGLAGLLLRVLPGLPQALPLLSFLLLGVAILRLLPPVAAKEDRTPARLATAAVLLSPALLRYSIQHLPDLFAVTLLTWGAATLRKKPRLALAFFVGAVTAKALTLFAVVPLLLWREVPAWKARDPRALLRLAAAGALIVLPFALWLFLIESQGIPNPFRLHSVVENRHSGSLGLLVDPRYYGRVFTWIAIKGTGLILFVAATVRIFKRRETDSLLLAWSAGIVPYWLLVRAGNSVHDYYSLPFVLPIALLGAKEILGIRKAELRYGLLSVNVAIALVGLARLEAVPLAEGQARPEFCGMENESTR